VLTLFAHAGRVLSFALLQPGGILCHAGDSVVANGRSRDCTKRLVRHLRFDPDLRGGLPGSRVNNFDQERRWREMHDPNKQQGSKGDDRDLIPAGTFHTY
jgi:hypothetical protein